MSRMLPTATRRCACCAVFILPNITALLLLAGYRSSQWQRRSTAIARYHQAVAWSSAAARSCTAALRYTLWPTRLTARLLLAGHGFGRLPWHTGSAGLSNNAVRHSGQSLRSCQRYITTFGMRWLVASVSVRGAGAPRTSTTDCIDPAACDRKCFRPPLPPQPAGQCRLPTLRGRAVTTSKCAVLPYGYDVPSPASLVAATYFPNSAPQVSVSHHSTTLRRSVGSAFGQQRSRASSPAHTRALRANGMATSTTAFVLRRWVASVSWQGGVPPYQAPWCRLADASCWQDSAVFVAVVALARYGHRLRRPSGLHRVLFCEVVASHCAKAPFGVAYRWRALPGLQNPPYAKSLRWSLRSAVALALVRRCAHCLVSGLRPVITS
jgi:hypothetical protein